VTKRELDIKPYSTEIRPAAPALTPETFMERWSYLTSLLSFDYERDTAPAPPKAPPRDDMEDIDDWA